MEKITMNVKELIRTISEISKEAEGSTYNQKQVREVIEFMEEAVRTQLAEATETTSVEVKLFNGVSLCSEYVAPHVAKNPKTGEEITVGAKNRVKAKISRVFKESVNA